MLESLRCISKERNSRLEQRVGVHWMRAEFEGPLVDISRLDRRRREVAINKLERTRASANTISDRWSRSVAELRGFSGL